MARKKKPVLVEPKREKILSPMIIRQAHINQMAELGFGRQIEALDLKWEAPDGRVLSTVDLMGIVQIGWTYYETALIKPDGEIDIIDRYSSRAKAIVGHRSVALALGIPGPLSLVA